MLALPVAAQDQAVAGGLDYSAGVLGVEYVRHVRGAPFGFAVGVGGAGVGARVQRRLREEPTEYGYDTRYVSAGLMAGTWTDPSVVVLAVEYGAELVWPGAVYLSGGAGGAFLLGSGAEGRYFTPSLRVVVGVSF